jgi:hypothetical protein
MARTCPCCGKPIVGHPNKKFCNSRCKDRYHNATNPRGIQAGREPYVPETDDEKDQRMAMDAAEGQGWEHHKYWRE